MYYLKGKLGVNKLIHKPVLKIQVYVIKLKTLKVPLQWLLNKE